MIDNIAYFMLLISVLIMVSAYSKQARELDKARRELFEVKRQKAAYESRIIAMNKRFSRLFRE
ncbi:hypothetical protein [Klebsiella phage vB_KpnS_SXFY507]|nr:hypothetical protein [Klebsiella phage vB_KpnS_SXFY507]